MAVKTATVTRNTKVVEVLEVAALIGTRFEPSSTDSLNK
jgi:hypothetical protein